MCGLLNRPIHAIAHPPLLSTPLYLSVVLHSKTHTHPCDSSIYVSITQLIHNHVYSFQHPISSANI